MSKEKIGFLLVGLNGATDNTTVAGSLALKLGLSNNCDGMITETELFSHIDLVRFNQFVFGGWDVNGHDAYKSARFFDQYMLLKEYYAGIQEPIMESGTDRHVSEQPVALEV